MSSTTPMMSSRHLRARSDLFPYQPPAIAKMVSEKQLAVMLKMGLGKTIITLSALVDLKVRRTIVFAPARVVELDVWGAEARAWKHTSKLKVVPLVGTPAQRLRLLAQPADVMVVSYELAVWLAEAVDLDLHFDAIVFDELSKLKKPGSSRFMKLRRSAMRIPVRFGLTGTPVGNHLLDLWGELFMVAGEKPLGPRFTDFREEYFRPVDFERRIWEPKHGAEEAITARVKPYAFSLDPAEAAKRLPEVKVLPVDVELPAEVMELENELAHEAKMELNGATIEALSSSALAVKVRQLASGAVYSSALDAEKWEHVHDAKLDVLAEMLDEMQGEPVMVCYWFRHELTRLKKRFPHARELADSTVMDAWNARKVELLLVHPGSAGHGLNLQHGGSTLIWYTLPWSLELWRQTNGRLARPGQKAPFVTAHALLGGEVDHMVLGVLNRKEELEARVVKAVQFDSQTEI